MSKKNRMGEIIISIFAGVLSAAVYVYFSSKIHSQFETPKLDWGFGIICGFLCTTVSAQLFQISEIREVATRASNGIALGEQARTIGSINHKLQRKITQLNRLNPLIHTVATTAMDEALDGFEFRRSGKSIHIKGRRIALHSYRHYWDRLVEIQNTKRRRIVARATHAGDVGVFYDHYARELRHIHRDFSKKRGRLFRILIDQQEPDAVRIKSYLDTITDMEGVYCVYINIFQKPYLLDDHSHREFCIDDETKFSVEWELRNSSEVQSFIMTEEPSSYDRNINLWNTLIEHIKQHDYASDSVEKQYIDELSRLRKKFLRFHTWVSWTSAGIGKF